ncbi:MAG: histidine phosphatase family protein, partial [Clostridia bacterium]|nr:histidine phosphatase family protein [Clostridia bacterium]
MELYLVRHGQSQSNVGIDVKDPALTETGHTQAQLAGEALKNVRFDRVYTSH